MPSVLCSAAYKPNSALALVSIFVLLYTKCWGCLVTTCKSGGWSCVANATVAEQKLVALEMLRTAVRII